MAGIGLLFLDYFLVGANNCLFGICHRHWTEARFTVFSVLWALFDQRVFMSRSGRRARRWEGRTLSKQFKTPSSSTHAPHVRCIRLLAQAASAPT